MIDVFRYYGSDWVGMVFGLIATYYLARERKRGFLFGVAGGIGWMVFGVLTQSVAGVLANAAFIAFNCRGFWRWKEKREKKQMPGLTSCTPSPIQPEVVRPIEEPERR